VLIVLKELRRSLWFERFRLRSGSVCSLSRAYLGIELESRYCALAENRLAGIRCRVTRRAGCRISCGSLFLLTLSVATIIRI
jgi:hypothetical protein